MRIPAFPSSHYRAQGMKPISWQGLVLWLTPEQYAHVQRLDPSALVDATDEQIARQDSRREAAMAGEARDLEELRDLLFVTAHRGLSGEDASDG